MEESESAILSTDPADPLDETTILVGEAVERKNPDRLSRTNSSAQLLSPRLTSTKLSRDKFVGFASSPEQRKINAPEIHKQSPRTSPLPPLTVDLSYDPQIPEDHVASALFGKSKEPRLPPTGSPLGLQLTYDVKLPVKPISSPNLDKMLPRKPTSPSLTSNLLYEPRSDFLASSPRSARPLLDLLEKRFTETRAQLPGSYDVKWGLVERRSPALTQSTSPRWQQPKRDYEREVDEQIRRKEQRTKQRTKITGNAPAAKVRVPVFSQSAEVRGDEMEHISKSVDAYVRIHGRETKKKAQQEIARQRLAAAVLTKDNARRSMTFEEAERAAYPDVEKLLLNICEVNLIENAADLVKKVLADAKSESTLARVASKWQAMAVKGQQDRDIRERAVAANVKPAVVRLAMKWKKKALGDDSLARFQGPVQRVLQEDVGTYQKEKSVFAEGQAQADEVLQKMRSIALNSTPARTKARIPRSLV